MLTSGCGANCPFRVGKGIDKYENKLYVYLDTP